MGAQIEKLEANIRPSDADFVQVKRMGNITEIRFKTAHTGGAVTKIDRDHYVVCATGEVLAYNHNAETRADNMANVAQSLKRLRDIINTNVTNPSRCRWITLTYRENMTDTKQLYEDFKRFHMRLRYHCKKQGYPAYEYIVCMEPQARAAWHAHLILIFEGKVPFIPNQTLAGIWGHGFVKIKALDNVDNVGLYFAAYLGDMELSELDRPPGSRLPPNIKLVQTTEQQKKYIVKGARLRLYPKGFRLWRKSRGIAEPLTFECSEAKAQEIVSGAKLTYEKTVRVADDANETLNIINYRHYNSKAK